MSLTAFARADARNVTRDSLIAVILPLPLLLAAALRFGYPVAERWAATVHGLDLAPHRSLVLTFLVILHVPTIYGMVAALLLLDDLDDRALLALGVTPVRIDGYLGYRLAASAGASLAVLGVTVPLSGMVPAGTLPLLIPSLVLAAACAPLLALATVAVAGNKVEGLALLKVLGIPFYGPLVAWFSDAGWTAVFGVLATAWPARTAWAALDGRFDPAGVAAGAGVSAVTGVLLWRRAIRRLTF